MNLKQIIFLILIIIDVKLSYSQLIFEQDIIRGGITAAGFSTGRGSGSGSFDIYIEPGSTIKKAYLFSYTLGHPPTTTFSFNNLSYQFKTTNCIMNVEHKNPFASPVKLYYKDITNDINPNLLNYNVVIPHQVGLPINWGYWTIFLVVIYENPLLSNTSYNILINDKDLFGYENYHVNNLNLILPNSPFGLSLYTDRSGDGGLGVTGIENNEIYVNSNLIGVNGGADNVNSQFTFGGVKGHFYYQNHQLFGLDDDIPNNTMSGSDGLADISSFMTFGANSIDLTLKHINYPNQQSTRTNINLAFFLAYSTPCEPFNGTLHSKDTTICNGESVRLLATGGQKYEWQPSTGLSCTECPAPFASPSESTTYTVRIWNNDSCNKVLPVRVNVSQPIPSNKVISSATCGESDGKIEFGKIPFQTLSQAPYTYVVNGDTSELGYKHHLPVGTYTYTIIDARGCSYTDTVQIEEINKTEAVISSINPSSGNAPLSVLATTTNSIHYYINNENFIWIANNDTVEGQNFNYIFDQHGEHEIMLITYNQYPHCADTTSTTILVYPSFFANIPNVFSPNNDGINDVFEIKVSNTQSVAWQIKNRWGNIVSEGNKTLDDSTQNIILWDGNNAADGVYFYVITATDFNGKVYEKQGKVSVFR